jgi:hypothetical protein
MMHSTEGAPLKELLAELEVDNKQAPPNGGHRQKQGRPYGYSGEQIHFRSEEPLGNDEPLRSDKPFRSDKRPVSKRIARSAAIFLFAVLVGVAGTLASQSYRDEIVQAFPPLGWLLPVSTMTAPAPSLTTSDFQEGLKPLAVDLALVRRSVEQLGSNLDQLARKQDQLAQNMATLQIAEQEVSQKVSASQKVSTAPPPSKPVHVPLPPPKSLQPPEQ